MRNRWLLALPLLSLSACATHAPPTGPRLNTRAATPVTNEALPFWAECLIGAVLVAAIEHASDSHHDNLTINTVLCECDAVSLC